MAIELISAKQVLAERLQRDPEFRAEWERTALARAVSVALVRYRADHSLSQRALAKQLGIAQSQVARLEIGENTPTMEMLQRLVKGMGQRLILAIVPPDQAEELELPDKAQVLTDVTLSDGVRLVAAVG